MSTKTQCLPYIIALGVSFIYVITYICFCKKRPNLYNILVIFISVIGAFCGTELIILVLKANNSQLGILAQHKLVITIGCVGIIWTSIVSSIDVFLKIWKRI